MQNKILARALATMMAASAAVSTASVPMLVAPIVALADDAGSSTDSSTTAAKKTATISVSNVEDGATVTAYQLVEGTYITGATVPSGYALTALATSAQYNGETVTLADLVKYSDTDEGNTANLAAWTAAVARNAASSTVKTYTLTKSDGSDDACTYSATAEPGLYVVLISKSGSKNVYNPVLLSVNVGTDTSNSVEGSTVDVANAFRNGTSTAYAKKSTSGFDKEIVNADGTSEVGKATTARASNGTNDGDTVYFRLDEMTIPSYSALYSDSTSGTPQYVITDTLETGCYAGITGLTVKVGDTSYTVSNGGYSDIFTITDADGGTYTDGTSTSYKITFTNAFLTNTANAGKAVEITYNTSLTSTATDNFAENVGHASLTYSYADSQSTIATNTLTDNTYVYTFGIDANIDSEDTGSGYIDYTLNKVTEKLGASKFETATVMVGSNSVSTKKSPKGLLGAEFELYSDEACQTQVGGMLSDSNGHLALTGLNAGTYYLKETAAPTGYTLGSTIYKIVIAATFDTSNSAVLTKYEMTVYSSADSYAQAVGSTVITAAAGGTNATTGDIPYTIGDTNRTILPVEIVNTTLQQLPFTGGEGRYAIYIGSIALAALVIILLVVKHRSNAEEQ